VIRESLSLAGSLVLFGISAMILKKTWYDRLERTPAHG
jgi:hypothetical protein